MCQRLPFGMVYSFCGTPHTRYIATTLTLSLHLASRIAECITLLASRNQPRNQPSLAQHSAAQTVRKPGSKRPPKFITKTLRFVTSGCFFLPRAWRGFWEQPRRQKIRIQEGTQTHY